MQFLESTQRISMDGSAGRSARVGAGNKTTSGYSSIVNIVLVEAKNLLPTDRGHNAQLPDPYVKLKLAGEKYKCKVGLVTVT